MAFADAEEQTPSSIDRREWVRFPSNLEALCWVPLEEGGEPWTAFVRDISAGGLGLLSGQHVEAGVTFALKLHSNHVNLTSAIEVTVTSAKPQGPDNWLIGCRFVNPLSEYERRLLL